MSHPHAVAVLPADCSNWGAASSSAPGGKAAARGYAIWVADTHNNRIRRIDAEGIITTIAGSGAATYAGDHGAALDASLAWPMGLTVLPSMRTPGGVVMVIADTYNHRVRVVNGAGTITTLAGNGEEGFSQDGLDARHKSLSHPFGVVAMRTDPMLDVLMVWFTESSGHKVRQIGPNRALYTLAGQSWPGYRGDHGPAYDAVLNQPKGLALVPNAAGANDDTVHLLVADSYNHAVRRLEASLSAPAVDPRSVHVQERSLWNTDPTPTASVQSTHTPTPTADVSSTHTPTPTPSQVATASASTSPASMMTASPTPSSITSTVSTPSGTPSASFSMTPIASASAAPSVAAGSTVVSTVVRLNNV
ncbi:hypothetical protein EON62_06055, partial [archaeon]